MSLSDYFRAQARWRREKADEYPDDERNAQSAAALDSLAKYVEQEDAAPLVAALQPYWIADDSSRGYAVPGGDGFVSSLGGEEAARAVSRYGFGYAATPQHHVAFLEKLVALVGLDAYNALRDEGEDGEDYSGELHPFEVDAARNGVHLPMAYFERRERMTEENRKRWVVESRSEGGQH